MARLRLIISEDKCYNFICTIKKLGLYDPNFCSGFGGFKGLASYMHELRLKELEHATK